MYRWHSERDLMLRRWRLEIASHEYSSRQGRPGFRRYALRMDQAPLPPVVCDDSCHCYLGPGFFRKRHPYDCGKTRCYWCHPEKLLVTKRGSDRRAALRFEEDANVDLPHSSR